MVLGYQLPGIPGLFHEAFSDCEQHHKALQEEKKLPGPEQLAWIGILFPGTPEKHPTGPSSKFWGLSGSEDKGGGDNSIQFINFGRVGDKSFKEW